MLTKVSSIAIFVVSVMISNAALAAQTGTYGGLAYHTGKFSSPGEDDFSPPALSIKYGKYVHDNLALEGRLLIGILRWKISSIDPGLGLVEKEIAVTNGYSLLVRGNLPLNRDASLYALAGYGQLGLKDKITVGGTTTSHENSESGLMYGLGAEATFGNSGYGIYAEFMSYPGGSGTAKYDYTGVNLGITKKF